MYQKCTYIHGNLSKCRSTVLKIVYFAYSILSELNITYYIETDNMHLLFYWANNDKR